MATVRWLNVDTGETKWGADDLYREGESSWVPVCRIKMPRGGVRENTLESFYLWIDSNFAMIRIDNTKSMGMVTMNGVTLDVAQKALFYEVLSRYQYLMADGSFPIINVSYKPSPISDWPDRTMWLEAKKTDEDTTDETPEGGGGGGNTPKPGRPMPRMNPFKKPKPGKGPPVPGPGPSDDPPPFPGPEPFLDDISDSMDTDPTAPSPDGEIPGEGKGTPEEQAAKQKGMEDAMKSKAEQKAKMEQGAQKAKEGKEAAQEAAGKGGESGGQPGEGAGGEPGDGDSGESSESGESGDGGEGDGDGEGETPSDDGTPSQEAGDDFQDAAKAASEAVDGARQCCENADPTSQQDCDTAEQAKQDAQDALDAYKEAVSEAQKNDELSSGEAEAQKTKADALKDAVDAMQPGEPTSATGIGGTRSRSP